VRRAASAAALHRLTLPALHRPLQAIGAFLCESDEIDKIVNQNFAHIGKDANIQEAALRQSAAKVRSRVRQ
jgi:hypothetical protein